jgi:hypothetical protein
MALITKYSTVPFADETDGLQLIIQIVCDCGAAKGYGMNEIGLVCLACNKVYRITRAHLDYDTFDYVPTQQEPTE